MFLAGNHTVNTTVNLTSISEITLRGERNSQVNILCLNEFNILIQNVSNLSIEGLVFLSGNTTIGTVALKIIDSNGVWIYNIGFQGTFFTGLHITSSDTITVTSCSFDGNTAKYGGAIYVTDSNLTLNASTFIGNNATGHGGAIYVTDSNLTLNASTFIGNNATSHGGAIYASGSNLTLSDNMFSGNTARNGGAMCVTAESNVTISDNAFTHNRAVGNGGAMYSEDSIVNIYGSTKNSSILSSEGYCRTCDMITTIPNSIPYEEVIMELNEALCATHFTNNTATGNGGAMSIIDSTILLSGSVIVFRYNSAHRGGALNIFLRSRVTSSAYQLLFISNKALRSQGGAVNTRGNFTVVASAFFIENTATLGGGIYTDGNFSVYGEIHFVNNTALSCGGAMYINQFNIDLNCVSSICNSNSALCIQKSNVIFSGRINISNNTGTEGGGIKVIDKDSHLYFTGSTVLYGNKAGLGGAIYSPFGTELTFSGDTLFSHNTADTNGGAIYSEYTNITFDHNSVLSFKWNTAENGGAIYLSRASFLTFNSSGGSRGGS